jgi:lipopolysaccharide transport protein LptA/LPS export ABC transporter protein LptC
VTPRTTRLIRGGLLAGMAVLAAVVTRSLSQSSRAPRPTMAASPSATESPTTATRMEGFTHFRMEMGETKFSVKAKSYTGKEGEEMHLQGVEVQFTYMARGKPGTSTITADESVYTPTLQKAVFRGNVHVVTEDGFSFDTASLVYRGDKNLSRTEDAVRFQRKDLSGTATGVVYDAAERRLELMADVVLKLQDPDNQPMDIKSARAVFERQDGLLKFIDNVEVVQGGDRLTAGRFLVNIADDTQAVYRAQAVDDVNLWMGGGTLGQGLTPGSAGRGPRHLAGRKLDLWFRPDRTLQDATAGPDAVLTLMPGKGDPAEKRILKARFLGFAFDERGKLSELRGQKDSSFVAQPLPPSKGAPRTLTCQSFIARVDPATGEPSLIEFTKDVVFVEGTQRATGEKAYFDGSKSALFLQEGPALADTAQGSKLTAKVIQVATRSGDVQAHDDVRHILDKPGAEGGLLGGKGGSTLLAADRFEYVSSTKVAHYRQSALLRTGKDEIRADEIRIQELAGGKRRLEAAGSVVSRMQPAAEKDAAKPAALVEARAKEMTYEEGKNEIVYAGDVVIRQGDIQTTSPKATLKLVEGNAIDTLVAGEPVEVKQGVRSATGARATYTPRTETMLLVGESVVLKDPTQELKGRSLTFHVGDARILVDGREQVRTELIIRQDKPKQ